MTPALEGGLALALASALALDAGFLLQHAAAARAPEPSLRRPRTAGLALFASGRWVAGFGLGLAGWALYVAALTLAPLSLVQAVAAGGLGLLVVLAAASRRRLPRGRERSGAIVATAGLAALALSAGRSRDVVDNAPPALRLCALGAAAAVVTALALRSRSAALGGLAAGLCYGLGDVLGKVLLVALPHHVTVVALASSPLLYATAAAHGGGFAVLQRSFRHGDAIASLGPMTAAANLVPIAAGILLLGERLPASGPALALRLGAFAATVAGASLLALRPATADAAERDGHRSAPQPLAATAGVMVAMPRERGGMTPARTIRVVAADDHPAYLRATTETLERAGLQVVGVSTTGAGALEDVRQLSPDVALVDLRMPGLSGADVARAVRARYPATRVVILSAYADQEIVQIALAAGATGYVTKDSTPEEIVRAVYRAAAGEATLPAR